MTPGSNHSRFPSRRGNGFTLTELLIVMGIILLFVLLAVPTIRVLSGQRSIAAAQNQVSAMLVRAREEAIGLQDYRGIMFYLDPATDRVVGILVRAATVDKETYARKYGAYGPEYNQSASVWLDLAPDRDSLMLPAGIRLQTILPDVSAQVVAPFRQDSDEYIGYNKIGDPIANAATNIPVGGVILFDGNGRLAMQAFGLACMVAGPDGKNTGAQTAMGQFLGVTTNLYFAPTFPTPAPMTSAYGLVLFDNAAFTAAGYTDTDPVFSNGGYTSNQPTSEWNEELWIDDNATPIFVNRCTGMLIRGE